MGAGKFSKKPRTLDINLTLQLSILNPYFVLIIAYVFHYMSIAMRWITQPEHFVKDFV